MTALLFIAGVTAGKNLHLHLHKPHPGMKSWLFALVSAFFFSYRRNGNLDVLTEYGAAHVDSVVRILLGKKKRE